MSLSTLPFPEISATLNAAATVFLSAGYVCIKRQHIHAHRACMLSAFTVSIVFLVSYVTGKYVRGLTHFDGHGAAKVFYFTLLITHTILAVVIVPLILRTVWLALRGDFIRHRAWARWTFPLWYYVSVTGVLVYFMLFRWFPHHTDALGL
jgi:putative membrane protein